ncbi:SpoIID/LytB domain-containing protein [Bacillus timonensis]|nr:SpoIID/LytB domain-containing protein [Bacillus timonensis]
MKTIIMIISVLFICGSPTIVQSEELIRVKLVNYLGDSEKVSFKVRGKYLTLDPSISLKEGVKYNVQVKNGSLKVTGGGETFSVPSPFVLYPAKYDTEHVIAINKRPYLGAMEFTIEDDEIVRPVNQLPLEDYLKGVVPFEVFPSWPIETLKAQALAARTYAFTHLHNEKMDDTIRFQVYGGFVWNEATTKAVQETEGEVISFNEKPIDAFYSASNGGVTENNSHVWGGKAQPIYPIKYDQYDPIHPWQYSLSQQQINMKDSDWQDPIWWKNTTEKDEEITASIKKWLKNNGYPGEIKIVAIPKFEISTDQHRSKRSISGSITIEFLSQIIEGIVLYDSLVLENVPLNRIRPLIGGNVFKSYLIDSLEVKDQVYTMKGRGYGHGVGMSQWGASVMGSSGKTYEEIVQFYFPGTEIMDISK